VINNLDETIRPSGERMSPTEAWFGVNRGNARQLIISSDCIWLRLMISVHIVDRELGNNMIRAGQSL
jgi:hypothetical protein